MSESTPSLELTDLAPDRVRFDLPGHGSVEMIDPRELSFYDRAELQRLATKLSKLNDELAERPTKARADELQRVYRELVSRACPDLSDDVVASIAPFHLDQIGAFFLARYGMLIQQIVRPFETMTDEAGISDS